MSELTMDGAVPEARAMPFRHVAAVTLGNALEFYDFTTYAFFALFIGRAFFPSATPGTSLLLSLATFGAGFLTRPIGAMIIGPLGDRIGRKPAFLFSFVLMGVSMAGLALTPSYASIGKAAPILVVLFRLLQGFALGGEVGPTTAYMVEAAPPSRRGFYASLQFASQDAAALTAGILSTVLANILPADQLADWGWRAVLLCGTAVVPFGLWLRHNLPETLHAANDAALAPDGTVGSLTVGTGLRPYGRIIILGLLILGYGSVCTYTISYMTTYALNTLHLPAAQSFGVIIANGLAWVTFDLVSGHLSDRFGRKPVMVAGTALLLLSIVPAFWLIGHYHNMIVFYSASVWMVTLAALGQTPIVVSLTESLPWHVRSGVIATVYAFAISIFGGSTQFVITWLIGRTGNPLAPAFYWSAATAIGLLAILGLRESAPALRRRYRSA